VAAQLAVSQEGLSSMSDDVTFCKVISKDGQSDVREHQSIF
jgi:hypothetical protein